MICLYASGNTVESNPEQNEVLYLLKKYKLLSLAPKLEESGVTEDILWDLGEEELATRGVVSELRPEDRRLALRVALMG